jgi:hypothetical protein
MGVQSTASVLTITVTWLGALANDPQTQNLGSDWNWAPATQAVPAALWGAPLPLDGNGNVTSPPASAETLPGRLTGISGLGPKPTQPANPIGPIPMANLAHDPIDTECSYLLPLSAAAPVVNRQPQASSQSLETIASTIASSSVAATRSAVFAALASFGYNAGADGTTSDIAAQVNLSYSSAPWIGTPWMEAP